MRLGVSHGSMSVAPDGLGRLVEAAKTAEKLGYSSFWMACGYAQPGEAPIFGLDPIVTLTAVAMATNCMELATGILPVQHRHPLVAVEQALGLSAVSGGRFTFGIGNSHQSMIEDALGMPWYPTAPYMRDYLDLVEKLLTGERVYHESAYYKLDGPRLPGANKLPRLPIILAAMQPIMLKLAGQRTDGTITGMTGPVTLERDIIPAIRKAAAEAGRPEPRVVANMQFSLTNDPDGLRERMAGGLKAYEELPSYKKMLEREGLESAGQLLIAGDEKVLINQAKRLRDVGVTDLLVLTPDPSTGERTLQCLAENLL